MHKWHENKWQDKSQLVFGETAAALTLLLENLNSGQRQKLMKNQQVAALLERYGVAADA